MRARADLFHGLLGSMGQLCKGLFKSLGSGDPLLFTNIVCWKMGLSVVAVGLLGVTYALRYGWNGRCHESIEKKIMIFRIDLGLLVLHVSSHWNAHVAISSDEA